jgi:hypothetical protein
MGDGTPAERSHIEARDDSREHTAGNPREQVSGLAFTALGRFIVAALAVWKKARMAELALLVPLYAMNGLAVSAPAGLLLFWVWHELVTSILTMGRAKLH